MDQLANFYLAHNPGWSLYHPEWAIHTPNGNTLYNQAITYNKGACVLHQLRYVLGDSIFFKLLHDYASDTVLRFKNAFTEDFVAKAQQVSGRDLTWFFDEWVYSPNHPVYQNTFDIDSTGKNEWRVSFIINQTQPNPLFFRMPIDIRITFSDATDTLITVMNDVNHQEFGFTFKKHPTNLLFDPNRNILLKQAATIYRVKSSPEKMIFKLNQNEPNPFSSGTMISYEVAAESMVTISILDSNGKTLDCPVNRNHIPGAYRFEWTNPGLPAGLHFLKMEASGFAQTRKLLMLK
jgi:hypothetical protein